MSNNKATWASLKASKRQGRKATTGTALAATPTPQPASKHPSDTENLIELGCVWISQNKTLAPPMSTIMHKRSINMLAFIAGVSTEAVQAAYDDYEASTSTSNPEDDEL